MNKPLLFACALAFPVTAFISVACDGSNIVSCESDADCEGNTDAPVCDTDAGQCVGEVTKDCTEDLQCQVTDSGGTAACEANDDCDAGEVCVEGSEDKSHCVIVEGAGCEGGATAVDAEDADGASVSVCVDTGVGCNADNTCE